MSLILAVILAIFFIFFIIFSVCFTWWRKGISYEFPRILMYHMISDHLPKNASKFNRLRVKPEEFERQLIWLKNNGFKSYTLNELINLKHIPPKSIVLTFDDGYKDNFTNAFTLLKKYGFKATIFIVINRFNADWASDKDTKNKSTELNAEPMLSNEDVREMIASGLIEIGSHTLNHVNLPTLTETQKVNEIKSSKEQIEKIFSISCNTFAYPFGFFDDASVLAVKNANYTVAITTQNDIYDRQKYSNFKIPRIMISSRQGLLAFILKIKNGRAR
ncbi:polysaccharide deacetylase family protein [Campylobacter sp. faydin G-105]|uniref:polysaccharide deacetylase family protein n=1 Tax=Campylobacter anatolicus TaxID=2829105 RepID=UPI001B9D9DAB|nr:polysaccharide deacetylase family protein [Campylobacter anatolicus]MBR8461691.1 polysaccharide deacetylase family protein [Campylobacter anatolicus]